MSVVTEANVSWSAPEERACRHFDRVVDVSVLIGFFVRSV